MLVLPSNSNNTGSNSCNCDVNKAYVDAELKKKVDLKVYEEKIQELENKNTSNDSTVIFETVEG